MYYQKPVPQKTEAETTFFDPFLERIEGFSQEYKNRILSAARYLATRTGNKYANCRGVIEWQLRQALHESKGWDGIRAFYAVLSPNVRSSGEETLVGSRYADWKRRIYKRKLEDGSHVVDVVYFRRSIKIADGRLANDGVEVK